MNELNYTFEEYLKFDRSNLTKSEYLKGQILAMPGGTFRHNLLSVNILNLISRCGDKNNCLVFGSDMKLYIPNCRMSVYPDAMMVCQTPQYKDEDILLNPTIIVEVLSPSTENYDRNVKLPCYQTITSVEAIALVSQKSKKIEVFSRKNNWKLESFTEGDFQLYDCEINMNELYKNITF
jgi:Uma2 family endonuclease